MLLPLFTWMSLSSAAPLPSATAIRSGVCSPAAVSDFKPNTDADQLAVARCHIRLKQYDSARTILQRVDAPGLLPYSALLKGETYIAEGRFVEAADILSNLDLKGDAAARAKMLRGRALVEAGRYSDARTILAGMLNQNVGGRGVLATPGGADPAEIRWWLAQGAVNRGAPEKAIPVWQTIWTHNPTSARAQDAAQALSKAGYPVPNAKTEAGRALIKQRIKALEKLYLHAEAWELKQVLQPNTSDTGLRADATNLFKAKDYHQAVVFYARIRNPTIDDQFDHALATLRTGDYAEASRMYEKIVEQYPDHKLADSSSYRVGFLAYDEGRLVEAIPLLKTHLVRYPDSQHKESSHWFIGWSYFRLGQLAKSEQYLTQILSNSPRSSMAPAARYWLARIHGLQGRSESAQTGYEEVLRRWPMSGYAWWSAKRLGRTYSSPANLQRPDLPTVLNAQGYRTGLALARAGFKQWARTELRPFKSKVKGQRVATLYLAEALVEAGDYVGAKALAKSYCPSPTNPSGDRWALTLCWPRPESGLISKQLKALQLPPNLPYSIMTAESALKPWVTSPAGARGLMQLMPPLAGKLHGERFPGSPYDPDQLYQPTYNAMLGVTELGQLQARFGQDARVQSLAATHSNMPLVIAGYNGGVKAVNRWLQQSNGAVAPDVFMENVGYTETRRYVRRVLGYMQTYRYVYGDAH